jgi:NAD-dependent deacetylase
VATPEAWHRNQKMVLDFYNQRRKQVLEAQPNPAHKAIAELEKKFHVEVVTQNIDDLHERAGSSRVLHLHGEIRKSRSSVDSTLIYDIEGWELKTGHLCDKGVQRRPHIVWFGELVPELENAARVVSHADVFIVIGSSLQVYPAAGLTQYASYDSIKYYIDPKAEENGLKGFQIFSDKAGIAVPKLVKKLLE